MPDLGFTDLSATVSVCAVIATLFMASVFRAYRHAGKRTSSFPIWTVFLIAIYCFVALAVFGFYEGAKCCTMSIFVYVLFVIVELQITRQDAQTPEPLMYVIWPSLVFAFLIFFGTLTYVMLWWLHNLFDIDPKAFTVSTFTRAQGLYETRSMLSGAHAIILGACALWFPFLMSIWRSARSSLSAELVIHHKLSSDKRFSEQRRKRIKEKLKILERNYHQLLDFADSLRPAFAITAVLTALIIALSALACFVPGDEARISWISIDNRVAYIVPPILAAFGMALLLWYVFLSLAFLFVVQPLAQDFDHAQFYLTQPMEDSKL